MKRPLARPCRTGAAIPAIAAILMSASDASGQLRPYDPFAWELFDRGTTVAGHAGVDVLWGQRASLAGTEGTLVDAGRFLAGFRSGRVAIEIGGTVRRFFDDDEAFAAPAVGVVSVSDGSRRDSGDYRIATTILLTPPDRGSAAIFRFGTRLPTTDNRVGLERDQTDFFALIGGRTDHGALRATAELGVGIHGARSLSYEQSDVFVFVTGLELRHGIVRPGMVIAGHADGLRGRSVRGNEELAELRLGMTIGQRYWVRVQGIRGFLAFSPRGGISLTLGTGGQSPK